METEGASEGIRPGINLETTEVASYESDGKSQRDPLDLALAYAFSW